MRRAKLFHMLIKISDTLQLVSLNKVFCQNFSFCQIINVFFFSYLWHYLIQLWLFGLFFEKNAFLAIALTSLSLFFFSYLDLYLSLSLSIFLHLFHLLGRTDRSRQTPAAWRTSPATRQTALCHCLSQLPSRGGRPSYVTTRPAPWR